MFCRVVAVIVAKTMKSTQSATAVKQTTPAINLEQSANVPAKQSSASRSGSLKGQLPVYLRKNKIEALRKTIGRKKQRVACFTVVPALTCAACLAIGVNSLQLRQCQNHPWFGWCCGKGIIALFEMVLAIALALSSYNVLSSDVMMNCQFRNPSQSVKDLLHTMDDVFRLNIGRRKSFSNYLITVTLCDFAWMTWGLSMYLNEDEKGCGEVTSFGWYFLIATVVDLGCHACMQPRVDMHKIDETKKEELLHGIDAMLNKLEEVEHKLEEVEAAVVVAVETEFDLSAEHHQVPSNHVGDGAVGRGEKHQVVNAL